MKTEQRLGGGEDGVAGDTPCGSVTSGILVSVPQSREEMGGSKRGRKLERKVCSGREPRRNSRGRD